MSNYPIFNVKSASSSSLEYYYESVSGNIRVPSSDHSTASSPVTVSNIATATYSSISGVPELNLVNLYDSGATIPSSLYLQFLNDSNAETFGSINYLNQASQGSISEGNTSFTEVLENGSYLYYLDSLSGNGYVFLKILLNYNTLIIDSINGSNDLKYYYYTMSGTRVPTNSNLLTISHNNNLPSNKSTTDSYTLVNTYTDINNVSEINFDGINDLYISANTNPTVKIINNTSKSIFYINTSDSNSSTISTNGGTSFSNLNDDSYLGIDLNSNFTITWYAKFTILYNTIVFQSISSNNLIYKYYTIKGIKKPDSGTLTINHSNSLPNQKSDSDNYTTVNTYTDIGNVNNIHLDDIRDLDTDILDIKIKNSTDKTIYYIKKNDNSSTSLMSYNTSTRVLNDDSYLGVNLGTSLLQITWYAKFTILYNTIVFQSISSNNLIYKYYTTKGIEKPDSGTLTISHSNSLPSQKLNDDDYTDVNTYTDIGNVNNINLDDYHDLDINVVDIKIKNNTDKTIYYIKKNDNSSTSLMSYSTSSHILNDDSYLGIDFGTGSVQITWYAKFTVLFNTLVLNVSNNDLVYYFHSEKGNQITPANNIIDDSNKPENTGVNNPPEPSWTSVNSLSNIENITLNGLDDLGTEPESMYIKNISSNTIGLYNKIGESINKIYSNSNTLSTFPQITLSEEGIIGVYYNGLSDIRWFIKIVDMCFPDFTQIITKEGIKFIKDIKRHDFVLTQNGYKEVLKNIKTLTPGGYKYVKFSKNCFKNQYPTEDIYITEQHSLSLGKFKNKYLHNGIHQDNLDDEVYLHIQCNEFKNKLSGITTEKIKCNSYHNLVFDEHQVLNLGGIGAMSHHPNGAPHKINKSQFINKINNKECKPVFKVWDELIREKEENKNNDSLEEYIFNRIKF